MSRLNIKNEPRYCKICGEKLIVNTEKCINTSKRCKGALTVSKQGARIYNYWYCNKCADELMLDATKRIKNEV